MPVEEEVTFPQPDSTTDIKLAKIPEGVRWLHRVAAGNQANGYFRRPGTTNYNMARITLTDADRLDHIFLSLAKEVWIVYI